jgi:hypothetical protein
MFLDADLGRIVVEWSWTAPALTTVPFWGLAALTGWAVVRRGARAPWFDRIALALTLAGGVAAIRSVVWFGLAALVLLPGLLSSPHPRAATTPAARLAVAVAAALVATAAAVTAISLPGAGTRAERLWPAAAAGAVTAAAAADPNARVFASERHADWLLWHAPELRGRVAFDARFELLEPGRLDAIARLLRREGAGWKRAADEYGILVLDPARPGLLAGFAAEPGARVLHRSETVAVVRRPA